MRKISLVLFAVVMMVSFAACGGDKKKVEAPVDAPTVEAPAPEVNEADVPVQMTPEEALKGFEEYVKEYAEANNNKTKNIKKYQDLAKKSQEWEADMKRYLIDFDAKQTKRYEKALETLININTPKK
ncbi:hypothetical protein LJC06_02870 [Bacteroidales bacterium OttesenSCG-928-I14]|nr:hypothetical protein [Bacteroidales bacterium OttesenSCG-928-I14]